MKNTMKATLVALASTTIVLSGTTGAHAQARVFANCDAMHRVYAHGVGKSGAHDQTSSTPVTNFKRNNALYRANKKSDRDGDGISCEAR